MSFSIRTTAFAAALCTFACGSFAETINITFGLLGSNVTSPVEVTELNGFKVSGAYAYDVELLKSTDSGNFYNDLKRDFPASTTGGFLLNKDGSSSSSKASRIVLSIPDITTRLLAPAGTSYEGQYISSLTYSYWGLGAVGVDGCISPGNCTDNGTASKGQSREWSSSTNLIERKFAAGSDVTRAEFFSENNGLFGLRQVNITLSPAASGNNVPEPASYALVGLALLAAGAASRRRV